jgi:hypothetical protein
MTTLYPTLINRIELALSTRDPQRTWATFDEIRRRYSRTQALSISADKIALVDQRLTARRTAHHAQR